MLHYHIFCCNMLIFACPIIANSQCWLFAIRANTGKISVFALKYPYLPSYIRIFKIYSSMLKCVNLIEIRFYVDLYASSFLVL
jgi:hypothetical protein